ncbi:hypothetical protein B0H11DRAFT_2247092 [Mycena galericulata]|nr:hypothetical protein B0H11DRAFT_2247092 [Mycena galericulata]
MNVGFRVTEDLATCSLQLRPKLVYFTIAKQLGTFFINIMCTVCAPILESFLSLINLRNSISLRASTPHLICPQCYEFRELSILRRDPRDLGHEREPRRAHGAQLEIHRVDLKLRWTHTETHVITLLPNQATELLTLPRALAENCGMHFLEDHVE